MQPEEAELLPSLHRAQMDFKDTVDDTAVDPNKATGEWTFPDLAINRPLSISLWRSQHRPLPQHLSPGNLVRHLY